MTEQPALFDSPTPPVKTPPRLLSAPMKPRWSKYRPKEPLKCDDCMLVLALAEGEGPASRRAVWRRKHGDADLLLCYAHAAARREEDGMAPLV